MPVAPASPRGKGVLAGIVLVSAMAAGLSGIAERLQEALGPARWHPEVPGEDRAGLLETIAICRSMLGRQGTLGIVDAQEGLEQTFIAYRLAYEIYPAAVVNARLGSAEGGSRALEWPEGAMPDVVLLLGADVPALADASFVARPAPDVVVLLPRRRP